MIKKMIERKKVQIEDKNKSTISKKEIKKFKEEANAMKKQFRDASKIDLGVKLW